MVQYRKEEAVAKVRRVVKAAETKARNRMKNAFSDAAKFARKWRIEGTLKPGEVFESGKEVRLLRRF